MMVVTIMTFCPKESHRTPIANPSNGQNSSVHNAAMPSSPMYTRPIQTNKKKPCTCTLKTPYNSKRLLLSPCAFSHRRHHDDFSAAAFSAATLASIFLRAWRIISSRRFCSSVCLSSLLVLHFFAAASASAASASDCSLSLSCRLYRWIRFGCAGFSAGFAEVDDPDVDDAVLEPGGGGGWKVMGG